MIPNTILQTAFKYGNEEYAWLKKDVAEALTALSENGYAMLGGELWIVKYSKIYGLLPCKDGSSGCFHWNTQEKQPNESWSEYCGRTATESLELISGLNVESCVLPELIDYVYYNLCFVTESEYAELK